mmetsp:Transcript_17073/g.23609  ORF Transcript_17073/g.23609 Transcript_17073/m.23609 type:complete len:170 (+) Transcript_17073:38-547(+)
MDMSAISQLYASMYFFAEAYYQKDDLYWVVQATEGIVYMVAFLSYLHMVRYDTSFERMGYLNVRQIATQTLVLLAAAAAFIDYLYWGRFPYWGVVGVLFTFSSNRQATYLAHEWLEDLYEDDEEDWDHYDEEHEMHENESAEDDEQMNEFFSKKMMNKLFNVAGKTVSY